MPKFLNTLLALVLLSPVALFAQEDVEQPNVTGIIEAVAEALDEVYVFPDVAAEMNRHLRQRMASGAYDDLDLSLLSQQLTEDLQSISHDLHLSLAPIPPADFGPGEQIDEQARQARFLEDARQANYGFSTLDILSGNVGYLDLRGFYDAGIGGATAVAAMNFLSSSDALIIDLRNNGGGSPSMVQLITSYFFEQSEHLNSFYVRRSDSTRQFHTQEHVQGPKMVDTPIWILTSGRTFSAAEEFTYNLKNMERARVIGANTGGGAHPVETVEFPEFGIHMNLPFGRAINPITGTNWEGTGVAPHVETPAENALNVAHREALELLLSKAESPGRRFQLQWSLDGLNTSQAVELTPMQMSDYTGAFGPRRVWVENGQLRYRRGGGGAYTLIPMSEDLFALDGLDFFRIKFERNEAGQVTALVGMYDNDTTDRNERTAE